jgi:hypothetical protein
MLIMFLIMFVAASVAVIAANIVSGLAARRRRLQATTYRPVSKRTERKWSAAENAAKFVRIVGLIAWAASLVLLIATGR